jgi:hypothetical protein
MKYIPGAVELASVSFLGLALVTLAAMTGSAAKGIAARRESHQPSKGGKQTE